MDIGLYTLKYPARKMIAGTLPFLQNISPNAVSMTMFPVGVLIAACYYFGISGHPIYFLTAVLLTFLRMFIGTLDGLIAEHLNKKSPEGEILNRLAPEMCDVMYLAALAFARPEYFLPGICVLVVSWLTTFAGLIGLVADKPIQSVGPVGQTDRLAALIVLTVAAYFSKTNSWSIDFIMIFLYWCIVGGIVTIILRLRRNFQREQNSKIKEA